MSKKLSEKIVDKIKWFAEIEKGVPFGLGFTTDVQMARIRLILVLVVFFGSIICMGISLLTQ